GLRLPELRQVLLVLLPVVDRETEPLGGQPREEVERPNQGIVQHDPDRMEDEGGAAQRMAEASRGGVLVVRQRLGELRPGIVLLSFELACRASGPQHGRQQQHGQPFCPHGRTLPRRESRWKPGPILQAKVRYHDPPPPYQAFCYTHQRSPTPNT